MVACSEQVVADGEIEISVAADDEEDKSYQWTGKIGLSEPLQVVASAWAHAHGVDQVDAVGLQEENGTTNLDLSKSPSYFGWRAGGLPIQLHSIPVNERYAETQSCADDAAPALVTSKRKTPTPASNVSLVPPMLSASPAAGGEDGSAAKRAKKEPVAASAAPLVKPAAKGKASAAAASSGAKPEARPKADAKPAPAPKAPAPKADAKPAPAPKAKAAGGGGGGAIPTCDDKIEFVQENPKRGGSSAHTRYEKYKKGKTVDGALKLGACAGDIKNDFDKGFLKKV